MADVAETRFGLDGKVTFELSDGSLKSVDLANLGGAAGAGVTNISFTRDASTVKIESDTGNDATVPEATSTLAGVMSAAQAAKLAAQSDTPVLTVAGKTGTVTLTGADVGLGNVNNTTDANKPVSTLQQLALNQKQNTLTGTGDVPGLTTTLAGKQATLTTYTEVPGLTVALNAKQATLTGVADVPNLQAALDQKQGLIAAGTGKLLSPGATNGAAPVQITLGTNLSFAGNTLNATGGGGGSTTYAALTDAATVSLPTINTPLNTALSSKAEATQALVVTTGMTLNRTPTTGGPTGHYNRQLGCAGGTLTVDGTGAVALDTVVILNTHASTNLVVTFPGSVVLTGLPGKFVEAIYDGALWKDVSVTSGTTYTDAQAIAAAVLAGTLGTDANKAPTHIAVTNAIAAIPGVTPLAAVNLAYTDTLLTKALHGGKVNNPRILYYSDNINELNTLPTGSDWVTGDTIDIVVLGTKRVAIVGLGAAITPPSNPAIYQYTRMTLLRTTASTWEILNPSIVSSGPAGGPTYGWHHQASNGTLVFRFGAGQSQDVYLGQSAVYNQTTADGTSGLGYNYDAKFLAGNTLNSAHAVDGYATNSYASIAAEITNPTTFAAQPTALWSRVISAFRTNGYFTNDPVTSGARALIDVKYSNGLDFGSTAGNSYVGHWARFDTLGNWVTSRAIGNTNEFRSTSTGSVVIPDNTTYITLAGAGSPNIGVDLPVNPFVGQIVSIALETTYAGLSIAGSGRTVIGNVMSLSAGSFASWRFTSRNTWQRVG